MTQDSNLHNKESWQVPYYSAASYMVQHYAKFQINYVTGIILRTTSAFCTNYFHNVKG